MNLLESLGTNIGTLLILLVAYKAGLLRFLINGKFMNGDKTTEGKVDTLGDEIRVLKENHFEHLHRGQDDIKASLARIENTLSSIDKYGVCIRKK